jgi:hypothetical protein
MVQLVGEGLVGRNQQCGTRRPVFVWAQELHERARAYGGVRRRRYIFKNLHETGQLRLPSDHIHHVVQAS